MTEKDRFPLSLQFEFLRMMDNGSDHGPFSERYTIVVGWRVHGELNVDAMRVALADVVERHETMRTLLVLGEDAYQEVYPPSEPDLEVRDLSGEADPDGRDAATERFINDVELNVSIPNTTPRIRVVLGRFDPEDAVLVIVAHHAVVDGWGAQVLMRDLAVCYAARRDGKAPDLPPARQYREFVAWQQAHVVSPAADAAREFWREQLRGAKMLALPTDRPRTTDPYTTGWHRWMFGDEFRTATLTQAREHRASPFMVLLAAFMTVLRDRTGETDLVVPTLTGGRTSDWMQDVAGTCYNFTPLRADISGCVTFGEVLNRVRTACLKTYRHELPFPLIMQEAPELMATAASPNGAPPAFQVIQHGVKIDADLAGGPRFDAVRRRVVSTPVGSQIPDGILAELDLHPDGGMFGKAAYVQHLFDESTVVGLMADLRDVLVTTLIDPSKAA
jgi:hypothetical protein